MGTQILVIGAGKSATMLIQYLQKKVVENDWYMVLADGEKEVAVQKWNNAKNGHAVELNVENEADRKALIEKATIVVSMMPAFLHFLVAKDCLLYGKPLFTASYVDDNMRSIAQEIKDKNLLFLCEMGLDPGIDHMSAMELIHKIKKQGGVITGFKSHCGGLIAPESDNNPWHYKISWNPRNVVLAGNAGAEFKLEGALKKVAYQQLFDISNKVKVEGLEEMAFYPNRDSLSYIPVYKLPNATTFIRTTLRYPAFFYGWNAIVQAGLTNDSNSIKIAGLTFVKWSENIEPFVNEDNKSLLSFLGLFDEKQVPETANTSADILQFLLETKLAMLPTDKDMIVMLHEFEYEIKGEKKSLRSSLIVKGEDSLHTAMAKTVGLPLGIAAKLILKDELKLTGLYIPTIKQIYDPVLKELEVEGIRFVEKLS